MKKSDFKDTLHFNEFPPISTEEWESVIEEDLKGKNYKDLLRWDSGEGISPLPFYREETLENSGFETKPLQHSGNWCILESIEHADVGSANKEALHALENGALGLSFSPDQNYLRSKEDLASLLNGIKIEFITLCFQPVLATKQVAEWLRGICEDQGLDPAEINVLFNRAPLSNASLSGELASTSEIKSLITGLGENFKTCAANVSIYGNAGATIIQQLAFALAEGNEYVGMENSLAKKLIFNFSIGPNYFLEIAKIRAFRVTWAQVLDEYGLDNVKPYVAAETGLWNKSKTDAHNNMLRTTTEAMSAALGGADSILVHRYDQHFSEDSDFASRIARNTQLILQEEAYLNKVADPGSGSYYIEILTKNIAEKAWELFQEIEHKGGFHECLQTGFIQKLISTSRQEKIDAFKKNERVLVGVNKYQPDEESSSSKIQVSNSKIPEPKIGGVIDIPKIEMLNIENEVLKGEA